MHISRFPRLHFAHLPTPLEPLENLSKLLGGPQIYIKRDDCTGLATGGNISDWQGSTAFDSNWDGCVLAAASEELHRQTISLLK